MAYKFYTDKEELFECSINVKNASTNNSIVRLIIETEDLNLIFHGKIDDNKCKIPVKKLKNILDENTKGTARLEVVLEDTYFSPWSSECIVEKYTKIEINEVKNTVINKPLVEVKIQSQTPVKEVVSKEQMYKNALFEIKYVFDKIKPKNESLQFILNEFFKQNTDYKQFKKQLLKEVVSLLKL